MEHNGSSLNSSCDRVSENCGGLHICFYLSDHGFGHIARNLPIMMKLLERSDVRLTVVCGDKHIAFAKEALGECDRVTFRPMHTDIGLILKSGTLLVDEAKLEAETEAFLEECPRRSTVETEWLKTNKVDVAVCDMPIWSIEACRKANVPLLYIGNFTWVEMYREHLPGSIWRRYAKEYQKLEHAVVYALHNNEMFEFLNGASDIEEVSVLCRPFHEDEAAKIKATHQNPIVFVALGMSAALDETFNVSGLTYDFIVNSGISLVGDNVTVLDKEVSNTQDYILASDYVITKAGWGTVAETLLAGKPLALFARDTVLEDRNTIEILEKQNHAVKITEDDLMNIDVVIESMKKINVNNGLYSDSSERVARKILSLAH